MRKLTLLSQLGLLAVSVSLSGCAEWEKHAQSTLPTPAPAYQDKQIQVVPTRSVHVVSFAEGALKPSVDEQGYLAAFLDGVHRDPAAVIMVEQPGRRADRVSRQRAASLVENLGRAGYKVQPFTPEMPSTAGLQVAIDHLVAIAPKGCPNWEMHPYGTFGSQPLPNMACADRTNLAAMVANPRDLAVGQVASGAIGHGALRGEINYRAGQTAPLQDGGDITGAN